jgi:hypothetical protein
LKEPVDTLGANRVFITGYPIALFDRKADGTVGGGCGVFKHAGTIVKHLPPTSRAYHLLKFWGQDFLKISKQDAEEIKMLGLKLNQGIEAAATKNEWTFVSGIADGFQGHGYCGGDNRYFVTVLDTLQTQWLHHRVSKEDQDATEEAQKAIDQVIVVLEILTNPKGLLVRLPVRFAKAVAGLIKQLDFLGTMHPNEKGHRVYADNIARALQRTVFSTPIVRDHRNLEGPTPSPGRPHPTPTPPRTKPISGGDERERGIPGTDRPPIHPK